MKTTIVILTFILLLSGCGGGSDKPKETTSSTKKSKIGCYISGISEASSYGSIGTTLYDDNYDNAFLEEVLLQRNFFTEIPANVYILYEPSIRHKNAYASSSGDIYFGYFMFYYTVANYGELAASGILAHEWGHRVQQELFGKIENPLAELEADAFSGYYMGLGKLWDWNQIEGYFSNVYATGDYNFHSPKHHGTNEQRLAAAYLGVSLALEVNKSGNPLSYNQLHELFSNQIKTEILGSSRKQARSLPNKSRKYLKNILEGKSLVENIGLPKNLTTDDVKKLWPFISTSQKNKH